MKSTDEPVVVEQIFPNSVDDVWNAITDTKQMQQWFFAEINEFDPVEGFETQFNIECDGETYLHLWKLIEVIPQKKIVYDWRYQDSPGQGKVTWELEPADGGTRLRLTNEAIESFPQDNPAFRRESCEDGWQYFINERLKDHLADADAS